MTNIQYRVSRSDERDSIYELYRRAMKHFLTQIWGWDEAWQRRDFAEHFDFGNITLAYDGETLVGYAQTEKRMPQLYLRMLVVHSRYRRQGIGQALLDAVIDSACERFDSVGLEVFRINDVAQAFYERNGFARTDASETSFGMIRPRSAMPQRR